MIIVYIVLAVVYMAIGARIERGRYALRKPNTDRIARLEYDLSTAIRKVNGIECKYSCDSVRYRLSSNNRIKKCSCGNQKTIARFKTMIPNLNKQLRKEQSVTPNYGTLLFWPALLLDNYVRGGTVVPTLDERINALESDCDIPALLTKESA